MTYRIIFRKKAESHVVDIREWYEKQKSGLGDEFFLSIEASLFAIERNPFLYQLRFKNIRCASIQRFPYGIYYIIDQNTIVILSVFHFKRNPKEWKKS